MATELVLKARGLFITSDPLSETPDGSLRKATNVDIDQNGLIEPRRGYEQLAGSVDEIVNKIYPLKGGLVVHKGADTLARYDSGSESWTDYVGSYLPLDSSTPVRSIEANENLYLSTAQGVQKLSGLSGVVTDSGVPQGLDCQANLSSAVTGFFSADNQLAYRVVWGYRDENDNLVLGAPSQRVVIANLAGGSADTVDLTVTIPGTITTDHFYQVYRSKLSTGENITPSDELGLVYESNPTAAEITAKELSFTDETPDDLIGATIYTASSQEGITNGNYEAPLAKDLELFKGYLFGANTKSKFEITINLLGVGGSTGLAADDTITIAGITYTAKASESIVSAEFKLFTAGTPSSNIADTAQSLVKVINKHAPNTSVYAYYMSGISDLPGQVRIVERDVGGSAFTTQSSRGGAFNPNLTTAQAATNSEFKNGLWFSKFQEPESVPLANNLKIGSAGSNILRIKALRESLFIFTETGIYTLTGSDSTSFRVDLLDNTARLLAPESVSVLQNQIYCLTDQGVVAVSETGVELVSRPIERAILEAFGANLDGIKQYSFGLSYESDRKYMLALPADGGNTNSIFYVYNTITNNWTTYDLKKRAGIVNPADDRIYLSDASTPMVSKERKTYSFRDQADEGVGVTVTAVVGTTLTLSAVTGLEIGDLYYESDNVFGTIQSIDTPSLSVTLDQDLGFSVGSHQVLKHFDVDVEWNPLLGGAPSMLKQFSEVVLIANRDISTAELVFTTDVSFNEESITFEGNSVGLWGLQPWGQAAWGGVSDVQPYRTLVPRAKQRAGLLRVRFRENTTYNDFQISGLRLTYRDLGGRIVR